MRRHGGRSVHAQLGRLRDQPTHLGPQDGDGDRRVDGLERPHGEAVGLRTLQHDPLRMNMKTPKRIPARRQNSRGVSLVEALVGGSLSLMVLGALYSFQMAQARAFRVENTYNDSQNVTRTALDLMAREIRMSSYDPSGLALVAAPPPNCPGVKQGLVEAFTDRIRIQQDLNGDGLLVGAAEDVAYDYSNGDLRRTDGLAAPVTLVSGVPSGGFVLRYFDNS